MSDLKTIKLPVVAKLWNPVSFTGFDMDSRGQDHTVWDLDPALLVRREMEFMQEARVTRARAALGFEIDLLGKRASKGTRFRVDVCGAPIYEGPFEEGVIPASEFLRRDDILIAHDADRKLVGYFLANGDWVKMIVDGAWEGPAKIKLVGEMYATKEER